MPSKSLSTKQIAQLGGFARARKGGKEAMAAMGEKGGSTTLALHGKEHFVRAAHARWGRLGGKSNG